MVTLLLPILSSAALAVAFDDIVNRILALIEFFTDLSIGPAFVDQPQHLRR